MNEKRKRLRMKVQCQTIAKMHEIYPVLLGCEWERSQCKLKSQNKTNHVKAIHKKEKKKRKI